MTMVDVSTCQFVETSKSLKVYEDEDMQPTSQTVLTGPQFHQRMELLGDFVRVFSLHWLAHPQLVIFHIC